MSLCVIKLVLFVAGHGPNSDLAVRNLHQFCEERYRGCIEIETVDVFEQPHRAQEAGVIITPMLFTPSGQRIIGNLSRSDVLQHVLDRESSVS